MSDFFDPTTAQYINAEAMPHAYAYNADGTLATDTLTYGERQYVKTFGYTAGKLTSESAWVKQ